VAKRASVSGEKASVLLNLPAEENPAGSEAVGDSMLGQIGDDTVETRRVVDEVPLSRIRANPFQPRWAVDEATVTELAHSMQQRGFLGILTARKRRRWYELAYGHQRLEAARRAGLTTLPVEVKDLSDEEMVEYALTENLQRKDLSQLEEGEMFVRWQTELGRSERDIAERLGKSRGYVRNRIETARLPDDLKEVLKDQTTTPASSIDDTSLPARYELSPAAAKELARIENMGLRQQVTAEVLSRQLNFQQTKLVVDRALRPARPEVEPEPAEASLENRFSRLMVRLEDEVRRVPPEERKEAIRALDELLARVEQMREHLKTMR
jgi:ParB/RepB/Spo0J family partition protein